MELNNEVFGSINKLRIIDMKDILKKIGGMYSLQNREKYVERLQNFKDVVDFLWREEQKYVIDNFLKFDKKQYVIHGIFGSGKCHQIDTPIILYNGKIKMVQDIQVGDLLMGDDSTPRKVMSLARGEDEMYDIIPIKGDKYTVNQEHILCLKATGYPRIIHDKNRRRYVVDWIVNNKFNSKSFKYNNQNKLLKNKESSDFIEIINNEQIIEISVIDYLKLPKSRKTQLKTYRVPVDFPEQKVNIDPYIIGYWLGDDSSNTPQITTDDKEIVSYFEKFCIPDIYKYNSRKNRLKLLAGLIDSDGHLKKEGGFEFTQKVKSEKLIEDIIYLARSLGFSCYKYKTKTTHEYKDEIIGGNAWRIDINGEGIEKIPTKIERKKAKKQIKDVLVSGIEVKHVGRDNYYGFTLDGNCRYLLGDFTVTHNTTLLLGLIINGLINQKFNSDEILFISFNISIKNEIKRKLKDFGLSSKVVVRTFDSIVYELAKIGEYPYLHLPNFDGKRKFVYELCFNKDFKHKPEFQPKVIFLDECQDLEKSTLHVLENFYPNTKFVFAGDIFQSIQKEPRESILWHLMIKKDDPDIYKIYMKLTPRVNPSILDSLKCSLKTYYPEFKDKIDDWESGNKISNTDIIWKRLNSYTHIFQDLKLFLESHSPKETMIITFSSAITVRGAMGDIARVRRFMNENNFKVNSDHKKVDPDAYFLSTAHSSKGLERDYVIIFLTFPLERAFVHLSDDVVVNLITVALTRAKKQVVMYVPAYEDKFSRALNLFENCPTPNKARIRDGKIMKEFKYQDYMDSEHCVTELIRASVIRYDTRISLRNHLKPFYFGKIFDDGFNYKSAPIPTEEERCFVGILIENLITSTWCGRWPSISLDEIIKTNPMYYHIINCIQKSISKYKLFISSNSFNDKNQFEGIYLYSQVHVSLSNKIFIRLKETLRLYFKNYWKNLRPKAISMKPHEKKLKIQAPVKMPWITGVADSISEDDDEKTTSIYEIKASQNREWVEDASIQIVCYALMTGKTWSRLHLLNPFQNSKISYYFDTKNILSLRKELLNDVLIYNLNSTMAKLYPITKNNEKIDVSKFIFLNILYDVNNEPIQGSIINMVSPIKAELLYNKYVFSGNKKDKNMKKEDKTACESELTKEQFLSDIENILNSEIYKDRKVWSFDKFKDSLSFKEDFNLKNIEEVMDKLEYKKNEELHYSLDIKDSLCCNILCLSYLFFEKNFI